MRVGVAKRVKPSIDAEITACSKAYRYYRYKAVDFGLKNGGIGIFFNTIGMSRRTRYCNPARLFRKKRAGNNTAAADIPVIERCLMAQYGIAPIVDGRGGGKPDMAMAGGSNQAKIQELLDAVAGKL